jgi:hypothetical protein
VVGSRGLDGGGDRAFQDVDTAGDESHT